MNQNPHSLLELPLAHANAVLSKDVWTHRNLQLETGPILRLKSLFVDSILYSALQLDNLSLPKLLNNLCSCDSRVVTIAECQVLFHKMSTSVNWAAVNSTKGGQHILHCSRKESRTPVSVL